MIKLKNKGFFLTETIVVIGIVTTVLVIFYAQISTSYRNYDRSSHYNTVEATHAVHNIKLYLEQEGTASIVNDLNASSSSMIDITSRNFDGTAYYSNLVSLLDIKKVYFSVYNINDVITNYATYNIDAAFIDYLRTLRVKDSRATYRIIIILNSGAYSSLLINNI